MCINATQSHSDEHFVAKKAVCNPEICLEKKNSVSFIMHFKFSSHY